jgi:hypothetical protein
VLEDGGGNQFVIPPGVEIDGGGYLVLAQDMVAFSAVHPSVSVAVGGWTFGINNGGEAVRLLNAAGAVIDTVTFSDSDPWPPEPDGLGPSLELVSTDRDNALPDSWAASGVRGGTPGARNSTSVGVETAFDVPIDYAIETIYPNPFRRAAVVPFSIAEPGHVAVRVFNAIGQHVATIEDALLPAGRHEAVWRPGGLAAGLYVAQLTVDGQPRAQGTLLKVR